MLNKFICKLKEIKTKIKIKKPYEYLLIHKIIKSSSNKKALIVEVNDFHNEILPGFIKYMYELGIKCDVLVTTEALKENVFFNIPDEMYSNLFSARRYIIRDILRSKACDNYKYIIFSSNYNYNLEERISDSMTVLQKHIDKLVFTAHHLYHLKQDDINTKKFIMLNNLSKPEFINNVVNPHYFGKINIRRKKNDHTTFIISGGIEQRRRNYLLLNNLKNLNNNNFKIIAAGTKIEEGILPDFCDCKGRLNFKDLYSEIENADFILLLLNPDFPEHQKYFKSTSSGSIQLSLGFLKPCIIQKKYAETYGFTDKNAIIYNTDEDFLSAIQRAVNMTDKEYASMQANLKTKADELSKLSITNLKNLLMLQG